MAGQNNTSQGGGVQQNNQVSAATTTAPAPVSSSSGATQAPPQGPQPPQAADPIIFTARDSLGIQTGDENIYFGIGNRGFELFHHQAIDAKTNVDLGVLSVSAPPEKLTFLRMGRDLNTSTQRYDSVLLGGAHERTNNDGDTTLSYAGIDFKGKPTIGLRYTFNTSEDRTIALDAIVRPDASQVGVHYKQKFVTGDTEHVASAGVSVSQNDGLKMSGTYTADRKFPLDSGSYVRGVFSASAAYSEQNGKQASLSAAVLKEVATYNIKGVVPVALEVGAGVEVNKSEGRPHDPKVSVVAQLKF